MSLLVRNLILFQISFFLTASFQVLKAESFEILSIRDNSKLEEAECAKLGGTLKAVCKSKRQVCIAVFSDYCKLCSDDSDCMGTCRISARDNCTSSDNPDGVSKFADQKNGKGYCSRDNNPCGCFQPVVKGEILPKICVD